MLPWMAGANGLLRKVHLPARAPMPTATCSLTASPLPPKPDWTMMRASGRAPRIGRTRPAPAHSTIREMDAPTLLIAGQGRATLRFACTSSAACCCPQKFVLKVLQMSNRPYSLWHCRATLQNATPTPPRQEQHALQCNVVITMVT